MGTRCLTIVTSKWPDDTKPDHHATIYRHWDGHIDGHGRWLADFLEPAVVTNGRVEKPHHYNGPGRLAAGIVKAMIDDDSDPDLMPEGTVAGQEFTYHVHVDFDMSGGTISVTVFDGPATAFGLGGEKCTNQVFAGSVPDYCKFARAYKDVA